MNEEKRVVKIGHVNNEETKTVTIRICNRHNKVFSLNGGTKPPEPRPPRKKHAHK